MHTIALHYRNITGNSLLFLICAMLASSCQLLRTEEHREAIRDETSWRGGVHLDWHAPVDTLFATRATALPSNHYNGTLKAAGRLDSASTKMFELRGMNQPAWIAPSESTVLIFKKDQLAAVERFTDYRDPEETEELFESMEDLYGDMGAADRLSLECHPVRKGNTTITNCTEIVIYRVQNETEGVAARCEVNYSLLDPNIPFTKLPHTTRVLSVIYYARDAVSVAPPKPSASTRPPAPGP